MSKILSAWWVIYHIDPHTREPRFLIVKRHALSKKIEWVAPKGKIQQWETAEKAALREISEEMWLDKDKLVARKMLDVVSLQLYNSHGKIWLDKDITYFLVEYLGEPDDVEVIDGEWFMWIYKRADITNAINLISYTDLRNLYRQAYTYLEDIQIKGKFIKQL